MKINPEIFKAYSVVGMYPNEVNEEISYLIGKAFAEFLKPKKVIVGRDIRESSKRMEKELIRGLTEQGVDVYEIGQITTDMLFFAVGYYGFDGGISATASHNPPGYGGFKFVREKAIPVTGNSGFSEIKELISKNNFKKAKNSGKVFKKDIFEDYKKFILSFIDLTDTKPQKVVFNTLGGAMGPVIEKVLSELPIEIFWVDEEPDPDLKKGEPNPLIPERRKETISKIKEKKVDFGVSWDGDGDRCFFFDEKGKFVPAPFMTSLMFEYLAKINPNLKVTIDLRAIMSIKYIAEKNNIKLRLCKSGRTFLQQDLRKTNDYMAAELTAHYFFKDYYYSDNGIIPFLIILKYLSESGKKLSELVKPLREKFFLIDEVKIKTSDPEKLFEKLKQNYEDGNQDFIDGLTVEYPNWRFNIRASNTETGVIRLNMEAKLKKLLEEKKNEFLDIINKLV